MFICKLGCPKRRGNHSISSKCRFRNPKIHTLHYIIEFKIRTSGVFFPVFLADLEMKYKNEGEFNKE